MICTEQPNVRSEGRGKVDLGLVFFLQYSENLNVTALHLLYTFMLYTIHYCIHYYIHYTIHCNTTVVYCILWKTTNGPLGVLLEQGSDLRTSQAPVGTSIKAWSLPPLSSMAIAKVKKNCLNTIIPQQYAIYRYRLAECPLACTLLCDTCKGALWWGTTARVHSAGRPLWRGTLLVSNCGGTLLGYSC